MRRLTNSSTSRRGLFLGFVAGLVAVGCGDAERVAFESRVGPIFARSCVERCHDAGRREAELDLTEGNVFAALVDVPSGEAPLALVEPGQPEASYLWHKLNGTHLTVGGEGERMPYGRPALDADELATIRAAIEELR